MYSDYNGCISFSRLGILCWRTMKFSKLFYVFKDKKPSDQDHFIFFDYFFDFVHKIDKTLKKYNVKRSFLRQNAIRTVCGKDVISVSSVIQYCFQQQANLEACRNIARQIEQELLYGKTENSSFYISSTLVLCQLIAKTKFSESTILFDQIQPDCQNVKTLLTDHKTYFNTDEWRKIVWFENHFSKSLETKFRDLDYEEVLRLKFAKFQCVLSFKECNLVWSKVTNQAIRDKVKRLAVGEDLTKPKSLLIGDIFHLLLLMSWNLC